jgi:hypothetical protein
VITDTARPIRTLFAVSSVVAALALPTASATAATIVGSDLSKPAGSTSNTCSLGCTVLGTIESTGNAYPAESPISGVVVSFGIKIGAAPETTTFRIGRVDLADANRPGTASATGPTVTLSAAGTYSIPARVPISAGDSVGNDFSLDYASQTTPCTTGASATLYSPPLVDGAPARPGPGVISCERLVNAVVEPDADHDAFGDETQDRCVGVTGSDGGCPPAASPTMSTSPSTPSTPCAGKTGLPQKRCRCKHKSTAKARRKCLDKVNAARND